MAVVVPLAPVLVDHVVASSTALVGGGAAWSILRDLNRTFQQNASSEIRQPLRELMRGMTLGESDSDRGIAPAHLARALIDVVDRLHPLVEATSQDRLLSAKERLADFAKPAANAASPNSGVFSRRRLLDRRSMDDLVDRQLAEAKLAAGGGALDEAVDTLSLLQEPQRLMETYARALCALEAEFADITPIGSVEGRLDFVQAALDPVTEIRKKINAALVGILEIRESVRSVSVDVAEAAVSGLVARGGKVEELRKALKKLMKSDIPQLLLKLRRAELERWEELALITRQTRTAYEWNLANLRAQLEAARNCMELGLKVLEGVFKVGEISRQRSCPFPLELSTHLDEGLLKGVLGSGIRLNLSIKGPPLMVPGPSESVWQVVVNLAMNARRAMGHSGKLTISIGKAEITDALAVQGMGHHHVEGKPQGGRRYTVLCVRDSGPGSPREALPRLFDFFSGANNGGQGLAVVRQIIVEDMDGFIGVDSATGNPHGTVFTIYFPRSD